MTRPASGKVCPYLVTSNNGDPSLPPVAENPAMLPLAPGRSGCPGVPADRPAPANVDLPTTPTDSGAGDWQMVDGRDNVALAKLPGWLDRQMLVRTMVPTIGGQASSYYYNPHPDSH